MTSTPARLHAMCMSVSPNPFPQSSTRPPSRSLLKHSTSFPRIASTASWTYISVTSTKYPGSMSPLGRTSGDAPRESRAETTTSMGLTSTGASLYLIRSGTSETIILSTQLFTLVVLEAEELRGRVVDGAL